jgi:hypothetical protein
VSFAAVTRRLDSPCSVSPLVPFKVPVDKARLAPQDIDDSFIPQGSLADPSILIRAVSPTTSFEFPVPMAEEAYGDFNVSMGIPCDSLRDSVTHVVGLPRVCGLSLDSDLVVSVSHATSSPEAWDTPSPASPMPRRPRRRGILRR